MKNKNFGVSSSLCIQFCMLSFLHRELGCLHKSCCQLEVTVFPQSFFSCFCLRAIPGLCGLCIWCRSLVCAQDSGGRFGTGIGLVRLLLPTPQISSWSQVKWKSGDHSHQHRWRSQTKVGRAELKITTTSTRTVFKTKLIRTLHHH